MTITKKISQEPLVTTMPAATNFLVNVPSGGGFVTNRIAKENVAADFLALASQSWTVASHSTLTLSYDTTADQWDLTTSGTDAAAINFVVDAFRFAPPALTNLPASTERNDWLVNLSRLVQFQPGNLSLQRAALIEPPTYAMTGAAAGTLTTAPTFALDAPSQLSQTHSLLFATAGTPQFATTPTSAGLVTTYSWSVWLKPAANAGGTIKCDTGTNSVSLLQNGQNYDLSVRDANVNSFTTIGAPIGANVWTHVLVVGNNAVGPSGTVQVYINGTLNKTFNVTANEVALGFHYTGASVGPIGGSTTDNSATVVQNPYIGGVADEQFWNGTALTGTDATTLAGGGEPGTPPTYRYKFDNSLVDAQGGGNSVITGNPTWSTDIPSVFASGGSLQFGTGSIQRLLFGANTLPLTHWAVGGWVKITGTGTYQFLIGNDTGSVGVYAKKNGSNFNLDFWFDGADHLSVATITANAWHFWVLEYQAGTATFYIDSPSGTADSTIAFPATQGVVWRAVGGTVSQPNIGFGAFVGNPAPGSENLAGLCKNVFCYAMKDNFYGLLTFLAASSLDIEDPSLESDFPLALARFHLNDGSGSSPVNTGGSIINEAVTLGISGAPTPPATTLPSSGCLMLTSYGLRVVNGLHLGGSSNFLLLDNPLISAGLGAISVGSGSFGFAIGGNFAGNAGGTLYAANETSSHDFANWQQNGLSRFAAYNNGDFLCNGLDNGQSEKIGTLTELRTIAAAAATVSTIQLPANAVILAVSVYVVATIPTASTFSVSSTSTATNFNQNVSTTQGATGNVFYPSPSYVNAAAQTLTITPNMTPGTATGKVRLTVHYRQVTPPTS